MVCDTRKAQRRHQNGCAPNVASSNKTPRIKKKEKKSKPKAKAQVKEAAGADQIRRYIPTRLGTTQMPTCWGERRHRLMNNNKRPEGQEGKKEKSERRRDSEALVP